VVPTPFMTNIPAEVRYQLWCWRWQTSEENMYL